METDLGFVPKGFLWEDLGFRIFLKMNKIDEVKFNEDVKGI